MSPRVATAAARGVRRAAEADAPPTREVILDTAERLFARRGVDGVAVRDLAREMHLTAPSLYNHFASKQALYDKVLERGLRPIAEMLAEAWHPGALRPEKLHATIDRLSTHLTQHPHLARLLQRALLEDRGGVHPLIAHWLGPVYRQGLALIRETADGAGWEPAELPFLALGLFGMVFAYFTNAPAFQTMAGGGAAVSARALTRQQKFLEKAIYRLLGPRRQRRLRRGPT